jgi:nucleoside-diphosphate-sugar epimerase
MVVSGGSGFIASRLVPRLVKAGHDVLVADIERNETPTDQWQACDVRDIDAVRQACRGRDVIINLAAQHRDDVTPLSLYDEVNVQGSRHVCQVAEELGILKIIFASSAAIYGFSKSLFEKDH